LNSVTLALIVALLLLQLQQLRKLQIHRVFYNVGVLDRFVASPVLLDLAEHLHFVLDHLDLLVDGHRVLICYQVFFFYQLRNEEFMCIPEVGHVLTVGRMPFRELVDNLVPLELVILNWRLV